MPKSKREKLLHLTQVAKKTREHKDRLFSSIRDAVPEYEHCFVVHVENMRNQHLHELRQELSDSRLFLGKTKLMARALGTSPGEALLPGIDRLAERYMHGTVGLLLTSRRPDDVRAYLDAISPVDFARAGTVATRDVIIPHGQLYSTGGLVPAADDVPIATALEPELRRLGVPTSIKAGKVVLEAPDNADANANTDTDTDTETAAVGGYPICRAGQVLDSRQSRLLRLFGICLSEFRVGALAYWSAASGEVTELAPPLPSTTSAGSRALKKTAADVDDIVVDDDDN